MTNATTEPKGSKTQSTQPSPSSYIDPQTPRVLGLDLSLTAAGWAVVVAGSVTSHGVIKSKEAGMARLIEISNAVFLLAHENYIDLAAIEGYSFGSRGDALTKLAELGGIVRYRLHEALVPVVEISPGTWRKEVLGKGNLAKDQVRLAAFKKYGLEIADHNALEAALIAMCAYRQAQKVAA